MSAWVMAVEHSLVLCMTLKVEKQWSGANELQGNEKEKKIERKIEYKVTV